MKKLAGVIALLSWGSSAMATDMTTVLPDAKPGECYARVVIPAQYRTESSTVVLREATERLSIVPAKYQWDSRQVLLSDASQRIEVTPATYRTVESEIETAPADTRWVTGSVYSTVSANPHVLSVARQSGVPIDSAAPGQCFAEYFRTPQYQSTVKKVLVSEATETIKVTPAQYAWVEERREVAPATQQLVEVPASYKTVTERIKVADARTVWKKGRGSIETIDEISGDVMCLVEVPAQYKTVEKTVLDTPSTTKRIDVEPKYETVRVKKLVSPATEVRVEVPAKYREITVVEKIDDGEHVWQDTNSVLADSDLRRTGNVICKKEIPARTVKIRKRVVDQPASTRLVEIPARYQSKKVRALVSEAKRTVETVPAITRQVSKQVKVADAQLVWQPVLCETNTTVSTIKALQNALTENGYPVQNKDGKLSAETLSALEQYQRSNKMATGGLTYEVLKKLGVSPGR